MGEQKTEEKKESTEIVKELQKALEKQGKEIEILTSIADKKALSLHYQRYKEDLPSIVSIRAINGKVIIGWKKVADEGSYQDPATKKWVENQIISVLYEDDTAEEMPLMSFYRRYNLIPCNRIGITIDEVTKETAFKLKRQDNGKEYTIGVQFVN